MDELNVFERLVVDLSPDERAQMLDKLKSSNLELEKLAFDPTIEKSVRGVDNLYDLSVIEKILIWFFSVFMQKKRDDVVLDFALRHCSKKLIESQLVTANKSGLRRRFQEELYLLSRSLLMFQSPVSAVEDGNKGAFYSLIFEIEFPDRYQDLIEMIDPSVVAFKNNLKSSDISSIKAKISSSFEVWLDNLDASIRSQMQDYAIAFESLTKLSLFPFNSFLKLFRNYHGEKMASIEQSKKYLNDLGTAIFSFKILPDDMILKALYIFMIEQERGEVDNSKLDLWVKNVSAVIASLKDFLKKTHYTDLLKFSNRNPEYKVVPSEPTADWFVDFKNFWKRYIKISITDYSNKAELEHFLADFSNFFGSEISRLDNYRKDLYGDVFPIIYEYSAGATLMAYNKIIDNILHDLKILIGEGDFFKQDNLRELESSYQVLVSIGTCIRDYNDQIAPKGKIGVLILNSEDEQGIAEASNKINRGVAKCIRSFVTATLSISNVLSGVLRKADSNTYDSLSNISSIRAGSNIQYIDRLESHYKWLTSVSGIINTLFEQEKLLRKID
ncbi:MAG: hypothetical protein JXR63_02805 [Spirochaetales bacterium]|nr:hypothetical protein [Spirochaetales bacterium]